MRIDTGGSWGRLGDQCFTEMGLARHAQECRLDLILVAHIGAASESVGGEDLHEADANAAILDLCRHDPRLAPLYWLRPGRPDHNLNAVAGALSSEDFCGVVLAPELNDFSLHDAAVDPLLRLCLRLNLPVLVRAGCSARAGPATIAALASTCPRLPILIQGACTEYLARSTIAAIARARADGHHSLKVDASDCDPESLLSLIKSIGADAVVFGTACGIDDANRRAAAAKLLSIMHDRLPPDDVRTILGASALQMFQRLEQRRMQNAR